MKILNANISQFTKAYESAAKFNKRIAQKMVFKRGLEGEIDDKFIRKLLPDHFDKIGNLTEEGKTAIKSEIFNTIQNKCSQNQTKKIIENYTANDYFADSYINDFYL